VNETREYEITQERVLRSRWVVRATSAEEALARWGQEGKRFWTGDTVGKRGEATIKEIKEG